MEKAELIDYIEKIKVEISQNDTKTYLINTRLKRLFLLLKAYSDRIVNDKLREYAIAHIIDMGGGYGDTNLYEKEAMIEILNKVIVLLEE